MFRRYRSPSPSRSRCRSRSRSRSRSRFRSQSGSRSGSGSGRESQTLSHRGAGASTMRVDHPNSESRAAVEREFAELIRRHQKLMEEKKNIRNRASRLEVKMDHKLGVLHKFERADALPTAVIHFVHLLEKANLYFQFKTNRPLHEPLLSDWIYKLLYRALQAGYVMDQDPEVELKKMMKSQPYEYDKYFLFKRLPAECKIVKFS